MSGTVFDPIVINNSNDDDSIVSREENPEYFLHYKIEWHRCHQ
jgi:hypothetical protein